MTHVRDQVQSPRESQANERRNRATADMWWILLLSCWSSSTSQGVTWYPSTALNAMLGEQVDLVGAVNASYAPDWRRSLANDGVNDATGNGESADTIDSRQPPVNTVDRDREPLDEVERIEPRQWPGRPDILPTRSTAPFTTETSLSPGPPYPTTLAQRNPSSQRYLEGGRHPSRTDIA